MDHNSQVVPDLVKDSVRGFGHLQVTMDLEMLQHLLVLARAGHMILPTSSEGDLPTVIQMLLVAQLKVELPIFGKAEIPGRSYMDEDWWKTSSHPGVKIGFTYSLKNLAYHIEESFFLQAISPDLSDIENCIRAWVKQNILNSSKSEHDRDYLELMSGRIEGVRALVIRYFPDNAVVHSELTRLAEQVFQFKSQLDE